MYQVMFSICQCAKLTWQILLFQGDKTIRGHTFMLFWYEQPEVFNLRLFSILVFVIKLVP